MEFRRWKSENIKGVERGGGTEKRGAMTIPRESGGKKNMVVTCGSRKLEKKLGGDVKTRGGRGEGRKLMCKTVVTTITKIPSNENQGK